MYGGKSSKQYLDDTVKMKVGNQQAGQLRLALFALPTGCHLNEILKLIA